MNRREFIALGAAVGAAFLMGAIGGLTDGHTSESEESGGEVPPP